MKCTHGGTAIYFALSLLTPACFYGVTAQAAPNQGEASAAASFPPLSISLKPLTDSNGNPTEVQTVIRFRAATSAPDLPLAQLPLIESNVITAAGSLTDLSARDDAGEIPIEARDEGEGDGGMRMWIIDWLLLWELESRLRQSEKPKPHL
jgi:hypothetical protein